jgi:hypothetical protein
MVSSDFSEFHRQRSNTRIDLYVLGKIAQSLSNLGIMIELFLIQIRSIKTKKINILRKKLNIIKIIDSLSFNRHKDQTSFTNLTSASRF